MLSLLLGGNQIALMRSKIILFLNFLTGTLNHSYSVHLQG